MQHQERGQKTSGLTDSCSFPLAKGSGEREGRGGRGREEEAGQQKTYSLVGKGGVSSACQVACGAIQADLAGGNQHPAGKVGSQCHLGTGPCTKQHPSFALLITTVSQHTSIH